MLGLYYKKANVTFYMDIIPVMNVSIPSKICTEIPLYCSPQLYHGIL